MSARVFDTPAELLQAVGATSGPTEWVEVSQERVNQFADATGDHQWIHVDPLRAAAGPYGACIAHGYLTLSMVNLFLPQLVEVRGTSMGINYGLERVRFPGIVPVGSRLRARAEVVAVTTVGEAVQSTVRVTVEREGADRPVCVADTISRYFPA
ncbi:MAG: MaoC family dehydratase [Gammaproteobacteria bacterium]